MRSLNSHCPDPQTELARAPVNENGEFEVTITDFSPEQTSPLGHKGELWVILRDAKTWNPIGEGLRPTDADCCGPSNQTLLSTAGGIRSCVCFEFAPCTPQGAAIGSFAPILLLTSNCILPFLASTTT